MSSMLETIPQIFHCYCFTFDLQYLKENAQRKDFFHASNNKPELTETERRILKTEAAHCLEKRISSPADLKQPNDWNMDCG